MKAERIVQARHFGIDREAGPRQADGKTALHGHLLRQAEGNVDIANEYDRKWRGYQFDFRFGDRHTGFRIAT